MKTSKPSPKLAHPTLARSVQAGALALAVAAALAPSASAFVVQENSYTMGPTSILNINNNAMVVHNGDLATLTSYLATGINLSGGGWWDGFGIQSAFAAQTNGTFTKGIGIILNDFGGAPLYATFQGVPVVQTDVLISYAWEGDADLDGFITGIDQFLLDDNVNNGNTRPGWFNGDFDYAGDNVSGLDQFLLDSAVNGGGDANLPLSGGGGKAASQVVPEPSALGLLGLGALGLLRRRSRTLVS